MVYYSYNTIITNIVLTSIKGFITMSAITNAELREQILLTVSDLVLDFLSYDRKDDDDLPRGAIEQAVKDDVITIDDIVAEFRFHVEDNLK